MKVITLVVLIVACAQALDLNKLKPPSIDLSMHHAKHTANVWELIKRKLESHKEIKWENKSKAGNVGTAVIEEDSRIIGGNMAQQGMFPWQAFLTMDNSVVCGGSLINPSWILTAGHCSLEHTNFVILLGAQNVRNNYEQGRQVFRTTEKYVHPGFNLNTLVNDITLLRLPGQATLTQYVNLIRLPGWSWQNTDLSGYSVTISGWGKTSDGSSVSNELMYTQMPVMSYNDCYYYWNNLIDSMLCTDTRSHHSTCNGDSGGPLIIGTTDGGYVQVGVVSFGSVQGCEIGYPAVFTRVTSFLQWIQNVSGVNIPPN